MTIYDWSLEFFCFIKLSALGNTNGQLVVMSIEMMFCKYIFGLFDYMRNKISSQRNNYKMLENIIVMYMGKYLFFSNTFWNNAACVQVLKVQLKRNQVSSHTKYKVFWCTFVTVNFNEVKNLFLQFVAVARDLSR